MALSRRKTCNYEGNFDSNFLRNGHGSEKYNTREGEETYNGSFINDNYHGFGTYKNYGIFNSSWTYEGAFFANCKHGYGIISLENNFTFHGLFRTNIPFGPGILRNSDGTDDVGFWKSNTIFRLIVQEGSLQELSTSPIHKIKAMRYRKFVDVTPEHPEIKIMNDLNVPEGLFDKLFSKYSKSPNSELFNKKYYDNIFYEDLISSENILQHIEGNCSLKNDVSELSKEQLKNDTGDPSRKAKGIFTNAGNYIAEQKQPEVNKTADLVFPSLLAWNNGDSIIEIMKYSFLNRHHENLSQVNILNIFCSRRSKFALPGLVEKACINLLRSCSIGDLASVSELIYKYKLNVNVTDNKGNGCLIRATVNDDHELLYLLAILGADMNIVNDEGFNAINHSLCRYIAISYGVKDWGKAFLSPLPFSLDENVEEWAKCNSTIHLKTPQTSYLDLGMTNIQKQILESQTRKSYIFNMAPYERWTQEIKTELPIKPKAPNTRKMTLSATSSRSSVSAISPVDKQRTEAIVKTVQLLVEFGINVNSCSVPVPSIILSIFCGEIHIVKLLLSAGADPSQRLLKEEGYLTALHIVCVARPQLDYPEIVDLLLSHGANPNEQAEVNFWQKEKNYLLKNIDPDEFVTSGLTPLQALCLRPDANIVPMNEVLPVLVEKLLPVTSSTPLFCGHGFLSLAVSRCSEKIVNVLLKLGEDPNENIHPIWGNILTSYLFYLGTFPGRTAQKLLENLINAGANPLRIVVKTGLVNGNAIDFAFELVDAGAGKPGPSQSTLDIRAKTLLNDILERTISTKLKFLTIRKLKANFLGLGEEYKNKVIKLQDEGRNKVDKHVRGIITRMLVDSLQ